MPTVTNKKTGQSWNLSELEARKIEDSGLRNLYKIERAYEPEEVRAYRQSVQPNVKPLPDVANVVKKIEETKATNKVANQTTK